MDFTGKLHNVQIEYRSRKPVISFLVDQEPNGIDDLQGKTLKIKVGKETKPRTLLSNSYFHTLCDKLRQKRLISMAECKNDLITSYGQVLYLSEGEPLIYKTNAPPEFVKELEEPHMLYLKTGEDGAYFYRMYRGSHTYDSEEMYKLIQGTIYECQQEGIETIPPMELKRLAKIAEDKKRDKAGR